MEALYENINKKNRRVNLFIYSFAILLLLVLQIVYFCNYDYDLINKEFFIYSSLWLFITFLIIFLGIDSQINRVYSTKLNENELEIIKNSRELKENPEHFKGYLMDIENLTYSIFIKAYEDLKAEPHKIEPISKIKENDSKDTLARENFVKYLKEIK